MVSSYSNFMVFKLRNNGERIRLDIDEEQFKQDNGEAVLKSNEVIIIVKEEIRRIYIWKGIESSVRKKFIASRVAASLQKELMTEAHFHRCKIVSIDQGDELSEFIRNFGFEQYKLSKKEISKATAKNEFTQFSSNVPINSNEASTVRNTPHELTRKISSQNRFSSIVNHSNTHDKEILKRILNNQEPSGYKRRHVLVGESKLYGSVEKKSKIFGNESIRTDWEPIKKFSKQILELDGFKLRIFIDIDKNSVQAIELLENIDKKTPQKGGEKEESEKKLKDKKEQKIIKLTNLYRLGPKTEQKFKAIGIHSVNDLLNENPTDLANKIDGASKSTIANWIDEVKKLLE